MERNVDETGVDGRGRGWEGEGEGVRGGVDGRGSG